MDKEQQDGLDGPSTDCGIFEAPSLPNNEPIATSRDPRPDAPAPAAEGEPFDYQVAIQRIGLAVPVLAMVDIDAALSHLSYCETMGPIVDPTRMIKEGFRNLGQQADLLRAAEPLIRYAHEMKAKGLFS